MRWKCHYCGDVVVSDSTVRHQMDYCKCGMTAVDYEEGYSRWIGTPIILDGDGDAEARS